MIDLYIYNENHSHITRIHKSGIPLKSIRIGRLSFNETLQNPIT